MSDSADSGGTTSGPSAAGGTPPGAVSGGICDGVVHAASNTDSRDRQRSRFMECGSENHRAGRSPAQCSVRGMASRNSAIGTSNGMPFSPTQW
ncbi:Uncharacterised protein [Bordetella pertussis]|nr:Uncharacterised protein [Bordetella pertussis]